MRNRFVENLYELAKKDKNVILMTGDLGFGVLDKFIRDLPDQYINAGIAEQNMMGVAAGMGISGKTVYVYSIGNFPTLRCIEQIRNDCCYHNANVKIICVGAGMSYGALGMSHHSTEDVAMMRSLAGVTVVSPASAGEVDMCMQTVQQPGVCYIRLGKGKEPELHPVISDYRTGDCVQIAHGERIAVLATGSIAEEAVLARETLKAQGIDLGVYTLPVLKPVNEEQIASYIGEYDALITLEEHSVCGGLFGIIAEISAKRALGKRIVPLGLRDVYPSVVGSQKYLRKVYGMDSDAVVKTVLELVSAK